MDLHAAVGNGRQRRLRQLRHADKPLIGEIGLDGRLRSVGVGQIDQPVFHGLKLPGLVKIRHHLLASLADREPLIGPSLGVERAVGIEDVEHWQPLPQAHLVVVGIMGWRDLHAAAAHLWLGPCVGHERNLAAQQRQPNRATGPGHPRQPLKASEHLGAAGRDRVELRLDLRLLLGGGCRDFLPQPRLHRSKRGRGIGVHRNGRVAQQRLGPRRGHGHIARLPCLRIDHRIADVPEVALHLLVENLIVADRRLQEGVPVDQPLSAADEPLLEEPVKRLTDRRGAPLVERKAGAVPVAARPQLTQLPEDAGLILLLPRPDPLHEFLAAEVVPGELFLPQQPPLDNRLRGDARVVGAGHPERAKALHAAGSHEDVLEGVVEGVAEVKGPRHVWRRDHHREDRLQSLLLARRGLRMPELSGIPQLAATDLGGGVVEVFRELVHRGKLRRKVEKLGLCGPSIPATRDSREAAEPLPAKALPRACCLRKPSTKPEPRCGLQQTLFTGSDREGTFGSGGVAAGGRG